MAAVGERGAATLPPVVFSTAYAHECAADMEAVFAGRAEGHVYSRMQNPTVAALEERFTGLCGARGTVALASGMTAIATGLMTMLRTGDEVIAGRYLFGGTYTLLDRILRDLGITTHFIDPADPRAAEALINGNTRAVFLEAIAHPAMAVPDFAAYRALCSRHGVPLLVDATLLTPCLYDPEALGADLVFFSGSKFLAGAASAVAGLIVDPGRFPWHTSPRFDFGEFRTAGQGAYLAKLRQQMMAGVGPCLSPMSAFLLLTGMESLALRLERQCDNAERAAAWLQDRAAVRGVLFPGLEGAPEGELTRRQFRGRCGSVLSFRLADKAACFRFLDALRLVQRAANLGDTKTLAVHPASTIYAAFWQPEQERLGVTPDLIRLSLGIEHIEDLLADLDQALAAV